jgi:circadian clock protein KaiB
MAKNPLHKNESEESGYLLQLYIAGPTARSRRAITNIKEICEEHLKGRYHLEITDIYQKPKNLAADNVVAAPTLIKKSPLPVRRFIGDLSDKDKVTNGLALKKKSA